MKSTCLATSPELWKATLPGRRESMDCCRAVQEPTKSGGQFTSPTQLSTTRLKPGFLFPNYFSLCFFLLSLHQLCLLYLELRCLQKDHPLQILQTWSSEVPLASQQANSQALLLSPSQLTVTMVDDREGWEVQIQPNVKNCPGGLLSAKNTSERTSVSQSIFSIYWYLN